MAETKQNLCPLFPDVACPRDEEAVEQCSVRINGDYNPLHDFKDMLVMHCALFRAEQQKLNPTTNK